MHAQQAADMIVRPDRAMTLLSRFQPLSAGDLLLTGTPGGTALHAPPKAVEKLSALLPLATKRWISFVSSRICSDRFSSVSFCRSSSWTVCHCWSASTCRLSSARRPHRRASSPGRKNRYQESQRPRRLRGKQAKHEPRYGPVHAAARTQR